MCNFLSAVVLKNGDVLTHPMLDSHSDLVRYFKLPDTRQYHQHFAKVELTPVDWMDVSTWTFRLDEESAPDWWADIATRVEAKLRDRASRMILRDGEHELIVDGCWVIGGDAKVYDVRSGRIMRVQDSARISGVQDSARISGVGGSARISGVGGSARISDVGGRARISGVGGRARISGVGGRAQISNVWGSAQISNVWGSAQISSVGDSAQISNVRDSAQISSVGGSAQISSVGGSARISDVWDSARISNVHTGRYDEVTLDESAKARLVTP